MIILQQYLRKHRLTQNALAARLGLSQGQISHWITGRRSPSVKSLKALSRETGISIDRLVHDDNV